jgi:Fe-S-cluster containining protein
LQEWETLLGIQWPKDACDRSGECCRSAAQSSPWANLLRHASQNNTTARNFLNQFIPYPSLEIAKQHAPHGVEASLEIAHLQGTPHTELVFYHCRFLKGKSECQIYEDRPALCRDYPESPFGAIATCCGYFETKQKCMNRIDELKQELQHLKQLQSSLITE